jgi:SAM-dependent methyltransferase
MLKECSQCIAEGIDFSDTMVALARRKNKKHIADGKVVIHRGNVDEIPHRAETFTQICSVNTIYFWPHPNTTSQKIAHLLKPGGKLSLGFEDIAQLRKRRLDTGVFRFYSVFDVEKLVIEAGFSGGLTTQSIQVGSSVFHCTVAIK